MNCSLALVKPFALAALAACLATPALAGKSADANACVNLSVAPQSPVVFNFTPVNTNCMNDTGNNASVTASQAGVTCAPIGYVEAKGSGVCAFETSTWNLSYSAPGTSWSGSTQSEWATGSGITLKSYSPQTSVNTSPASSTATSLDWNDNGPIFIIFSPGATSNAALATATGTPAAPVAAIVPVAAKVPTAMAVTPAK